MSETDYLARYERVQSERRRFVEWIKANHRHWTPDQQHAAWQAWRQCTLDAQTKATA